MPNIIINIRFKDCYIPYASMSAVKPSTSERMETELAELIDYKTSLPVPFSRSDAV